MSELQARLKKFSTNSAFTAKGDEILSAKKYYANGLDCLLAAITQAARADGMDQLTIMKLLLRHADENSAG